VEIASPKPAPVPPPPERPVEPPPVKPDPEALAKADYDTLVKFNGIPESDTAARIAAVESYLKAHGQSAFAYPARELLAVLKKAPAPAPEPQRTDPPPVESKPAPIEPKPTEPKPSEPKPAPGEGWQELFNGKTLDGWQSTSGKWGAADGALANFSTVAGSGARIETLASFDDFEFSCEIQSPNRYAMIQLRDTGISFKLKPRDSGWDTLAIKAVGASVQCSLNGADVAPSDDKDDNLGGLSGKLAFYAHASTTIKIRNLKLRRIQHK
jgi:hypothetical protein